MKSSSSLPAPALQPTSGIRRLQWLLFSLLVCGFLLALPSQASVSGALQGDRADHLITGAPFIVTSNDLLRALRLDASEPDDDAYGGHPFSILPAAIFQPPSLLRQLHVASFSTPLPLPVSTRPGAPRGPPVVPR